MCYGRMIVNKARCTECDEILVSTHRHDWVQCSCPNGAFVDGGLAYTRRGAKDLTKVEELSEWDDHLVSFDIDWDKPKKQTLSNKKKELKEKGKL